LATAFVMLVLYITSCSSTGGASSNSSSGSSSPSASRYDQEFDAGPDKDTAPETIAQVLPKPVVRTRAGNYSPYTVLGKTYHVLPDSDGFVENGSASWYGSKFHGHLTSNGEIFDMFGMTAAHKSLPIPTYAEVTNLDNGRKVIVRINDRGPFHGNRVIDLSWAAASKLGYADKGVANVRIVALDAENPLTTLSGSQDLARDLGVRPNDTAPAPNEAIPKAHQLPVNSYYQIARLTNRERAVKLSLDVESYVKFPVVIAEQERNGMQNYLVLIGPLHDRRDTNELSLILELAGQLPGFLTTLQ